MPRLKRPALFWPCLMASCLLWATPATWAEDVDGWELPENFKGKLKTDKDKNKTGEAKTEPEPKPEPEPGPDKANDCPKGYVRSADGWCVEPESRPEVPKTPTPTPAPKPETSTPPATTPTESPVQAEKTKAPVIIRKLPEAKPDERPKTSDPALNPETPGEPEAASNEKIVTAEKTKDKGEKKDEKKDEKKKSASSFIKGELANFIGATKLATSNNRIGVRLGYRAEDLVHYGTITPEADLRFGKLTFGLGVPLALEIYDGNLLDGEDPEAGFDDAGAFRSEDWDEPGEYLRFIRYLTWGRKEDNIYFSLSQLGSNSLGHGALMRRYSVNVDPDSTRVSGQLDMYNDYAGFEFMTNSIVDWELFGALAFVKPLSFFMDHPMARSMSIGVTYVGDRAAPVRVETESTNPFYVVGDSRPSVLSDAFVHAVGVDVEFKVFKSDTVDLKPYIDYSWMMPQSPSGDLAMDPEGGGGFTLGLLGRFNLGSDPVHAFRLVAEFRSFSANYLPGYFDTFYEVHKFAASQRIKQAAAETNRLPATKFEEIFVTRKGDDRHLGFYLEFNYSMVGSLAMTFALEGSDAELGNNFMAHLEVPALDWLQFFASYHQRAMDSLGDLFDMDASDKVLFTAARLRLLPFLFINARYHYTLRLKDDYADLVTDPGEPEVFLEHYRFYQPAQGWMVDVELGWEF